MRNVLAVFLAAVAAVCGAFAWAGFRVDGFLGHPDEIKQLYGPVIDDPQVRERLTKNANETLFQNINVQNSELERLLEEPLGKVVNTVLDTPEAHSAWLQSLDESRAAYVDQVRSGHASAGDIPLILDPFAKQVNRKVDQVLDQSTEQVPGLRSVIPKSGAVFGDQWRMRFSITEQIPISAVGIPMLTMQVQQSAHWEAYAVVSAASFILALLIARRRAVPFVAAGVVALAFGALVLGLTGMLDTSARVVSEPLARPFILGIRDVTSSIGLPVTAAGGGLLVLGLIGLAVGRARRRSVEY